MAEGYINHEQRIDFIPKFYTINSNTINFTTVEYAKCYISGNIVRFSMKGTFPEITDTSVLYLSSGVISPIYGGFTTDANGTWIVSSGFYGLVMSHNANYNIFFYDASQGYGQIKANQFSDASIKIEFICTTHW